MGKRIPHIVGQALIGSFTAALLLACNPLPVDDQPPASAPPSALPSTVPPPAPTTSIEGFISETIATSTAREIAQRGEHYLGGALEPPKNLRAELASLATAQQRLVAQGWPDNVAEPSDRMVWFVTMEGTWKLIGGPPAPVTPEPTSPPHDFHYFVVILDAKTGAELGIAAR